MDTLHTDVDMKRFRNPIFHVIQFSISHVERSVMNMENRNTEIDYGSTCEIGIEEPHG